MILRSIRAIPVAFSLASAALPSHAQEAAVDVGVPPEAGVADAAAHWRVMASPGMLHFKAAKDHEQVYMLGLERVLAEDWVLGGAYFHNSYAQPSGFAYGGRRYDLADTNGLFAQWSAGLLYGYKKPWANKVPLNHDGFSPGLALSLGWQFATDVSMQVDLVGTAGLMMQFSIDLR